jgi:hypothetical protein
MKLRAKNRSHRWSALAIHAVEGAEEPPWRAGVVLLVRRTLFERYPAASLVGRDDTGAATRGAYFLCAHALNRGGLLAVSSPTWPLTGYWYQLEQERRETVSTPLPHC